MSAASKKKWARPLADFVGGAVDPVTAKLGFGQSSLILHWEEILGARLATGCEPIKLQWGARAPKAAPDKREPATLLLRVHPAFALEIQHSLPIIVERVNAHLGWRAIGKIALRQGPLLRQAKKPRPAPPEPGALARAAEMAQGVEDEFLRDALVRLGGRVLSRRSPA